MHPHLVCRWAFSKELRYSSDFAWRWNSPVLRNSKESTDPSKYYRPVSPTQSQHSAGFSAEKMKFRRAGGRNVFNIFLPVSLCKFESLNSCPSLLQVPLLEPADWGTIQKGREVQILDFRKPLVFARQQGVCIFTSDEFWSFAPVMCIAVLKPRCFIGFEDCYG